MNKIRESTARYRQLSFLLIEDDEDHAQLVIRSLNNQQLHHQIAHIHDGDEALAYLFKRDPYHHRPLPDVILLDLNLPKVDGHEVLRQIKNDPQLKMIPVVVLTTSDAETDRIKAYQEYANSYLVKPLDFQKFCTMAENLNIYWGTWNKPAIDSTEH